MDDATTTQGLLFADLFARPLHVRFDQPDASADGGAVLLGAADKRLGLSAALAAAMRDERDPSRVRHSFADLLRQRVFLLAAGYEDCNDAARLIEDPIPKLWSGVIRWMAPPSPPSRRSVASRTPPTGAPSRLGHALADTVIARHKRRLAKRRVRRITLDMDPTYDQTHGQQQLTLFNAHYGGWCYLPVHGFIQFDNEGEQYLFASVASRRPCGGERGGVRDPLARG